VKTNTRGMLNVKGIDIGEDEGTGGFDLRPANQRKKSENKKKSGGCC